MSADGYYPSADIRRDPYAVNVLLRGLEDERMDLQRLQSAEDGMSVADQIKKAVTRMPPGVRLDMVMKLVGMGLEADERLQDVVVEGWELVVKEEWWKEVNAHIVI